ncbi:MAG: hypothetical protein OHK0039_32880 [Bacteroidia bacterium]
MRGYDREEVDAFLAALSQEWEQQLDAQRKLKEEQERLQTRYNTLKEVEDMLHKTLMQAEHSARDTLDNARQKAELRLREADMQAREIVRKGIQDRALIEKEIGELTHRRDQLLKQLQLFLQNQLDHVQAYEQAGLPESRKQELAALQNGHNGTYRNGHNGDFFSTDDDKGNSTLVDDITREL